MIAAILTVVLLLTGAKVFASVNAEIQFSEWYVRIFQPFENSLSEMADTESLAIQESLTKYVDEMFGKIKDQLAPTSAIKTAKEGINNQKEHYKTKLNEAKETLNTDDFQTFEEEQREKINMEIDQDIEEFLKVYLEK